jgi:uroporphyrinogen decarboxylase
MKEIQKACAFNILHVCDYVAPYANFDAVYDYPGHVINSNVRLTEKEMSVQEISRLFKRPFMGGMDRHGVIAKGSPTEVEAEIKRVVKNWPKQFILGADCTVAGETDWKRLRHAIDVAHSVGA